MLLTVATAGALYTKTLATVKRTKSVKKTKLRRKLFLCPGTFRRSETKNGAIVAL